MSTNRSDKRVAPPQPNLPQEVISWLHRSATTTGELCAHIAALAARVEELRVLIETRDQQNSARVASPDEFPVVTLDEAARRLACSKKHINRLGEVGELVIVRRGRYVRVIIASIDAHVERLKR
jgi:excisionase family DNA binding protein